MVRILCVGTDEQMLSTRCAVLNARGYASQSATPIDVDERLRASEFDLVILSVMLSDREKQRIKANLPSGSRVLDLDTLVFPAELFGLIRRAVD
jgi:DNA-binding response OmpR family regulator